jgi:hypothetical protein
MTYLSNQQLVETKTKNAEGVRNLQPRVARVSALPWVTRKSFIATLKGLLRLVSMLFNIRELFQSSLPEINTVTQGVALGWNLLTPSAFTRRNRQMIRQIYECP